MYKLSVCITVYNQYSLLKCNLDRLLKYKGSDIQIVVSDNCSTEDIKGLVDSYHDERIKYCCTEYNCGHDGNIINAIINADSDYIFLLRTRDLLIESRIETLLNAIDKCPEMAYCRFSAIDEDGKDKLSLETRVYRLIRERVKLNNKLINHPSGELYNKKYMSNSFLLGLRAYLQEYFPNNDSFFVDVLLRYYLLQHGPFVTSSEIVWVYTNTLNTKDASINSAKDNVSIYSPRFQYPRLFATMSFIDDLADKRVKKYCMEDAIKKYTYYIIFQYKAINDSEDFQKHYNCVREEYSRKAERSIFLKKFKSFISANKIDKWFQYWMYVLYFVKIHYYVWTCKELGGKIIRFIRVSEK